MSSYDEARHREQAFWNTQGKIIAESLLAMHLLIYSYIEDLLEKTDG